MLISFPIQSLNDAAAMVEFSRFPASLAIAAEIYSNLETAVRAAEETGRADIFDATNQLMARLDGAAQRQLSALKKAWGLDAVNTCDTSQVTDSIAMWLHASDSSAPDRPSSPHLASTAAGMQLAGAAPTRPAIAKTGIGPDPSEVTKATAGGDRICPLGLNSCPFHGAPQVGSEGGENGYG
jgi:hypothetical protein